MGDPRIDRIAARQAAQTAATRLTVTPLMADTAKMSDEQVGKLTALFEVLDPDGHSYSVGDDHWVTPSVHKWFMEELLMRGPSFFV